MHKPISQFERRACGKPQLKKVVRRKEATVVVQKVGNLQIIIEALDFASRTHRANLEELLKSRDEAIVEPEPEVMEDKTDDNK